MSPEEEAASNSQEQEGTAVVLDENGEPLSKNALKKKLKAEKAAKEKAEKEAKKVC